FRVARIGELPAYREKVERLPDVVATHHFALGITIEVCAYILPSHFATRGYHIAKGLPVKRKTRSAPSRVFVVDRTFSGTAMPEMRTYKLPAIFSIVQKRLCVGTSIVAIPQADITSIHLRSSILF